MVGDYLDVGVVAGVAAGCICVVGGAGLAGRYSGPLCPQAVSKLMGKATVQTTRNRFKVGFTFRITIYQYSLECNMTESEFLALAESSLDAIEGALERATETSDLDVECSRSGNVLEIEFVDNGSKIIVNSQAPMQELWVAAKSGGFHYKCIDGQWRNTRDGSELFSALSKMVSMQSGIDIVLGVN